MRQSKGEQRFSCNAPLYRFVYRRTHSLTVALVLCGSFLVVSAGPALAAEEEAVSVIVPGDIAELIEPDTSDEQSSDVPSTEDGESEQPPADIPDTMESDEPVVEPAPSTEPTLSTDGTSNSEDVTEEVEVSTPDVAVIPSDTSSSTASTSSPVSNASSSNATTTQQNSDDIDDSTDKEQDEPQNASSTADDTGDESASTTPDTTDVRVDTVVNDGNFYQFSKDECVRVADGSFYCGESGSSEAPAITEDSLISVPDKDGDLEIFLYYSGEETQLTHNTVDDASPYFDPSSNTIVWHRLLDDRYQIVSYDIDSANERVLTNTQVNNMEPSRYGEHTAWQRWVDGTWQIILSDGRSEQMISDSPRHAVAPLVYESFVLWNTMGDSGEQRVVLYDIETGQRTSIDDTDGMAVQNPRMVLLYETTMPNGDVVTKGFDLESRTVVPLSGQPRPLPKDLPESDQTGETRALIQNKLSGKESEGESDENVPVPTGTSTPPGNAATATTSVSAGTTTSETIPEEVAVAEVIASSTEEIPDLVVPAFTKKQASTTHSNPDADLIIPPAASSTVQ